MKKRISLLLLAAAMLCALAAPALADVLWEPYGNSFYEQHREECQTVDRSYLANGRKGYVTLFSAPGSAVEAVNIPNGSSFHVGMSWTDKNGAVWLVAEYGARRADGGWERFEGWVPASETAMVYDDTCFREDHEAEFAQYDGSGDALTEVALYAYPGGQYSHNLTESKDYAAFADAFQHLYTDENGRRWSYIGYYMGRRNAWACLDDPLNENLGADGPRAVFEVRGGGTRVPAGDTPAAADQSTTQAIVPPADNVPAAKNAAFWAVPAGLVALAAAGTAVLAGLRRKKGVSPS